MPRALITGVTGQDGAYLAQLLLEKGYEVFGVVRRSSHLGDRRPPAALAGHRRPRPPRRRQYGRPAPRCCASWSAVQPDEIYNLAAQSFVATSWDQPLLTGRSPAVGVVNMLEAMRVAAPKARFYQASSSEMFGLIAGAAQNETTPFYPRSPYAVGQALRPLDDGELPRELRPARLVGHPVQPREPAARHRVRHAQGHRRRGAHQARPRAASCGSATSTPSATGATPRTTCAPCG